MIRTRIAIRVMMMTTRSPVGMTDLHALAEALGVRVRRVDHGPPAYYRHSERTIYTRRGQSVESYRSALAHELVHAYYGDAPCRDPVRHGWRPPSGRSST